ncbi:hypothetical protein BH23CHL2_BH23CHL2_34330 [soil metagenome]
MTNQTQWTNNISRAVEVDGETKVTYLGTGHFNVRSATSDTTYRVTLQHVDGEPVTSCTCTAGSFGQHCWHQAEALLMAGVTCTPKTDPWIMRVHDLMKEDFHAQESLQ